MRFAVNSGYPRRDRFPLCFLHFTIHPLPNLSKLHVHPCHYGAVVQPA